MTQPHIPPQPQPVPSLGVARLVFLGHESRHWLPTSGGFH